MNVLIASFRLGPARLAPWSSQRGRLRGGLVCVAAGLIVTACAGPMPPAPIEHKRAATRPPSMVEHAALAAVHEASLARERFEETRRAVLEEGVVRTPSPEARSEEERWHDARAAALAAAAEQGDWLPEIPPAAMASGTASQGTLAAAQGGANGVRAAADALSPSGASPAQAAAALRLSQSVGQTITVLPGDTLYALSERHTVSLRALIDANGLSAPFVLTPGQPMVLPPPTIYVVQPGDTLYAIARRFRIDRVSLAHLNGFTRPYTLRPGDEVHLPALALDWAARAAPLTEAGAMGTTLPEAPRAPDRARPRGADPVGPTPRFSKPVEGEIVSRFGETARGQRNDGVNFKAPLGAPVRASADGLVVYAGAELRGYGNLILIKHADGWVSAYAHASEMLVEVEETVRKGQVIAKVGASGAVETPQLHFELRKRGRPVDPLTILTGAPS